MADTVHVVFAHHRGPMGLGAPDFTLRARSSDALRRLPDRLEEALAGEYRFACGLLPYALGGRLHNVDTDDGQAVIHLYRNPPRPYTPKPNRCFELIQPFQPNQERSYYQQSVARILDYLAAGDGYQVNYAQRFQARWRGDSLAGFDRLLAAHPAPHACYFRDGNDAVFGVSPERFLKVDGRRIVTEPIKGSRPRGDSPGADRAFAEALLASDKDRAENLMIVDLLRNDLGRLCEPGSIHVAPLFELRRFSNVQHLVSTVTGTLCPGVPPLHALLDAFPGGSITGAPKKRAMQIIAELEPAPRGAYCGSFFWQDDQGHFDSNILIRTLQTDGDRLYCHGGGGIVFDSVIDEEYVESRFKIEKLMAALEGKPENGAKSAL